MKHGLTFLLVLLFLGGSLNAVSDDMSPRWKSVGPWDIRIDTTIGSGCFSLRAHRDGTITRFGLNPASRDGYTILGNPAWRSLEEGKTYDLEIQFDNLDPWYAPASAFEMGFTVLFISFDDANFLIEFAERHRMIVRYQGREIASVPLDGSHAALMEMINCQEAQDEEMKRRDPFSEPPETTDPFAP